MLRNAAGSTFRQRALPLLLPPSCLLSTSSTTRTCTNTTSVPGTSAYTSSTPPIQLLPPHFVDVTPLAVEVRSRVRKYTLNHSLKLIGILADVGPFRRDSELYSDRIAQCCGEDNIDYELWRCAADSPLKVKEIIQKANEAQDVDGILVFYPIFPTAQKGPYKNRLSGVYYKTHDSHFRDLVAQDKDVEGLRGTRWYHNPRQKSKWKDTCQTVFPCTARSVQAILERYHSWNDQTSSWYGQVVSIVNRSEIIGRPLAAMLAAKGATVYSIDERTVIKFLPYGERLQRCNNSFQDCLAQSHIIVTGVPHEDFQIPIECVAHGATLVNVSEFTNVNEESLLNRTDVRYIPQVGKVTVALLEDNLIQLHRRRLQSSNPNSIASVTS